MKKLVVLVSLLSIGAVPTQHVMWTQSAVLPEIAQAYIYKLYVREESGAGSVVTLSGVLCNGVNGLTECEAPLPYEANAAIVTNNLSQLTATDPTTGVESELSQVFMGDQGCIFRDNLYVIGAHVSAQSNKQNIDRLYREFQTAKFKFVSTDNLKGNQYLVTEECVGYLVS